MTSAPPNRPAFLGAFFRAEGSIPYGVFSAASPNKAPAPYPTPGAVLFGTSGYCDRIAPNGYSISSGYAVDPTKLADIVNLGVKWTRTTVSQYFDDDTHIFGPGAYYFSDMDSDQCAQLRDSIAPVIGLEAGPVQYDAVAGIFSPAQVPTYESAADFGTWCGAVAQHEARAFPAVTRFSLPGNEVNTNPTLFPGGEAQIAAYSEACYKAIKIYEPNSIVYGFELNMVDGSNPSQFVADEYKLGCHVSTCYDRIALHLDMPYPIPAATTPCFPNAGGSYSLVCIQDIQTQAHAKIQVLVSETVYTVPGSVPDEATKAAAIVAEMKAFAGDTYVDGVSYADVDECALYTSGFFIDGCLIDTGGQQLPAYTALKSLAQSYYN